MTIYVDDSNEERTYQGFDMVLCRMFADTERELHGAASLAGASRRLFRRDVAFGPLYWISTAKKRVALAQGVQAVTREQAEAMLMGRMRYLQLRPGAPINWPLIVP